MSSRRRPGGRTLRRQAVPDRSPSPADTPDVITAAEMMIALLDGRPFTPLIDPARVGSLLGGFMHLAIDVGVALHQGDRDAFRQALADMQATERLKSLFGDHDGEAEQSPP